MMKTTVFGMNCKEIIIFLTDIDRQAQERFEMLTDVSLKSKIY